MTLPAVMHAVAIREPGGPEVLTLEERPVPVPGEGEVLIRVAAAGINRPDVIQRQGRYPPPPGASDLPGLEVAGEVVAAGGGVTRWHVGDEICALLSGGGYAEYAVAPAGQCLPCPAGLSLVDAAALPETCFTVWTNVFERGRLRPGETLLVHGGSSGIGTTAIQCARQYGAVVYATAGSVEKVQACEALGATRGINYRSEDFVTVCRATTDGRGVDVILDMVGGSYIPRNVDLLAEDGRLVQIALLEGAQATLNFGVIMRRRLTITGSTLRPRSVEEKTRLAREVETHVWPWVAQGVVRPQIFATLPLAEAAEAHRLMESSRHIGKIVLTV
jgi:putative PIG3 family NAD(P)H quinone oxidoreductase